MSAKSAVYTFVVQSLVLDTALVFAKTTRIRANLTVL